MHEGAAAMGLLAKELSGMERNSWTWGKKICPYPARDAGVFADRYRESLIDESC